VKSLQTSIFGFGLPPWLKIRIRLFPKGEELLVVLKRGGMRQR
jgi:hypothetical protein